ncbi:TPA: hypothetical protein N0F65_004976 [Lagenidium giganteum]|uniref:Integrase catalytic domain-containing protein n=1 Tax=Lagenidium giganteum TaxID=4803 RepID=A0AAV2ZCD8_9STRA|nr:TPA: hypothetical protein N0F65_004976 [Lagenidium giganteum]
MSDAANEHKAQETVEVPEQLLTPQPLSRFKDADDVWLLIEANSIQPWTYATQLDGWEDVAERFDKSGGTIKDGSGIAEEYTQKHQLLDAVIKKHRRPIAFWSKKCNETRRAYPANKRELLSTVLMLLKFRGMLLGQELHIHTDHLNLTHGSFNNVFMLRWRLEIEEFEAQLHYVKGSHNSTAPHMASMTELDATFSINLSDISQAQRAAPGALAKEPSIKKLQWLIHPGASTMHVTMAHVFMWPNMGHDVKSYVAKCVTRRRSKHPTVHYGKLPTKATTVNPWFEIAVDSIGPYGPNKFRAITIVDTSTRLMELQPVADGSSAEATVIVDRPWLCRYPRPRQCIYDQGSESKKEFAELQDSDDIKAIRTTVRNAQANGVIERVHRVIGDKMRTTTINLTDECESFLHNVTFALRAAHHSMLGDSPAQAAFGRDMLVDIERVTDWAE